MSQILCFCIVILTYQAILCSSCLWELAVYNHLMIYNQCMEYAFLIAQLVMNPPAIQETSLWFLGQEDLPGEGIGYPLQYSWASLVAQLVKNLPAIWETWVLGSWMFLYIHHSMIESFRRVTEYLSIERVKVSQFFSVGVIELYMKNT